MSFWIEWTKEMANMGVVRLYCMSSVSPRARVGTERNLDPGKARIRHGRRPPAATLGENGNGVDSIQEQLPVPETLPSTRKNDVMKLFNDTQQNMLYLNKQRLAAIEELQKEKRNNEFLHARVAKLEAEYEASVGECDVLQKKLNAMKSSVDEEYGGVYKFGSLITKHENPSLLWSELLLRIDSIAMTGIISMEQSGQLRKLVRVRDPQAADVFKKLQDKDDRELAAGLLSLLSSNRRHGLHVVHICAELDPVAVGSSLAPYVSGLCRSLRKRGHLVEVILPKYESMDLSHLHNLKELKADLYSYFNEEWHKNKIWTGILRGVAVTLIAPCNPSGFFSRDNNSDEFARFSYFSRSSLEYVLKSGKRPDVLHIHNWQTALVAPLFWEIYANQGLQDTRILFTCQNFKLQCLQEPHKLRLCGLDPETLNQPDRLQDNLQTGRVNLVKGGIIYSNKVTTVSALHAHDALAKEHSHGLDSTLNNHKIKFGGAPIGVDVSIWDPTKDHHLPSRYSAEDLSGKQFCKTQFRQFLRFAERDSPSPLVGCISKNVTELELEFLKAALECTGRNEAEFVFVGASKDPGIQLRLEALKQENKKGYLITNFDESIAHELVAASDMLVCPSVFEPSDQWPLIAMSYGTVPVSREIYGIHGRVIDADDVMGRRQDATGFSFCSCTSSDLASSLNRAINQWRGDQQGWMKLIINGMKTDISWDGKCVEAYETMYFSMHGA